MSKSPIDLFFNPGSVAIVGATEKEGKIPSIIMDSLRSSGYGGEVFPINPKYKTVAGLRCFSSIADIGKTIDVAVFALPASAVPSALRNAGGKARGAIIVSGGFAETGEGGTALEREIKEIAAKDGVRVIGPNCMGIFDSTTGLDTFFIPSERIKRPKKGGLSIVSQSGSFAITAMDELAAEGIGVARVVSYGNKADVNEADCLEFLARDEATTAVALYIESVEDGRRFIEAAKKCSVKKPVLAVKVGKGGAGITAARSHTGAMAGRYEAYKAAFVKAGVIELAGYEEFLAACKAFGAGRKAAGNKVMIITDGGGMGVGIADACHALGLDAAPLGEDLREKLKKEFPPFFAISNPLDLTGSVTDEMYADALEKTMIDGGYDMVIVAALWGPPALTDSLAELVADRAALMDKPVLICSPGGEYTRKKSRLFIKHGLPVYPTPEAAVRAASVLARASQGKGKRAL